MPSFASVKKDRLADKAVNTLQNHYGMVIRQNTGDLMAMKGSVIAQEAQMDK